MARGLPILVFIVVLLAPISGASAADAPELATAQEAFDSGNYRQALQSIGAGFKAIPTTYKPDAGQPDMRVALFSLRGECHLKLASRADALEAFKSAATYASTEEQQIPAKAMVVLLQAAPKLVYPPAGEGQIDITDRTKRPAALTLLFNDRLKAMQKEIDAAAKSNTSAKAKDLLPKFVDLYLLEKASGENAGKTLAASEPIAARCGKLASDECSSAKGRVEEYRKAASVYVWVEYQMGMTIYKYRTQRGLDSRQKDEMKDLVASLRDIKKFMQTWHELNPDPKADDAWTKPVAEIDETLEDAKGVLNKQWYQSRP